MTPAADRTRKLARPAEKETVVGFSPREFKAPFVLRCGAALLDYIILIGVPVMGLIINRLIGVEMGSQAGLSNNTAWFIAVLLGISDLIVFPVLSGQTLGMMITGLRIVCKDGREAPPANIIVRNTLGYTASIVTFGLGFLLAGITPAGRALHDYISGTMVVFAKRRRL